MFPLYGQKNVAAIVIDQYEYDDLFRIALNNIPCRIKAEMCEPKKLVKIVNTKQEKKVKQY